jgi:pilus assembly protein Flp/PilA
MESPIFITEFNMKTFANFIKDESGATAIEYGLIAALISIAAIAIFSSIGTELKTTFSSVQSGLSAGNKAKAK